jgi:ubiquitin C-terminal hydrolase
MSLIVPGLRNAGSSCYANSIFQALAPLSAFQCHLRAILEIDDGKYSSLSTSSPSTSSSSSSPSSSRSFWNELWNSLTSDDEIDIENDNEKIENEEEEGNKGDRLIINNSQAKISKEILSLLRALCVTYSSSSHPPASIRPRIQAIGDLSESPGDYYQAAAAALVQQDAHEFLICLLSAIADRDAGAARVMKGNEGYIKNQSMCFQRWAALQNVNKHCRSICLLSPRLSSRTDLSPINNDPHTNSPRLMSSLSNSNPLINPFCSIIGRRVVCLACDENKQSTSLWKSTREEALTLDPPQFQSSTHSIESLLSSYFSANTISGYVCENSKCSHVAFSYSSTGQRRSKLEHNALRISCILQPPLILALHIGRLQFGHKVHTHFKFKETLSLAPYTMRHSQSILQRNKKEDKDDDLASIKSSEDMAMKSCGGNSKIHLVTYDLISVVEHIGNANSGHYITYRRISSLPSAAEWVVCSDGSVRNVSFSEVASCAAYLLFYEQRRVR